MTDSVRTLLRELADEAPPTVDRAAVQRGAERRRASRIAAAAIAVAVAGTGAALLRPANWRHELTTAPTPASSLPPLSARAPIPDVIVAAEGSRVAQLDRRTGDRTGWVSPEETGTTIKRLVVAGHVVLYESDGQDTRRVHLISYPSRPDSGPASLGDPGTFMPTATPDFRRYAMFATSDDAAYSPRPRDLRLIVTEADPGYGTQGVWLDPDWRLGGLTFADDRVVASTDGQLRIFRFTAPLGRQEPEVRVLPAPSGCAWTLPTAVPEPDRVLVLERCSRTGDRNDAVVVDLATGDRIGTFTTVLPAGRGEVDSLDLDNSGQHLLAQVHDSSQQPGFPTTQLDDGRTLTTTMTVSPTWR